MKNKPDFIMESLLRAAMLSQDLEQLRFWLEKCMARLLQLENSK